MAGRMIIQKTLFLDEKNYNIFQDFVLLLDNLASNLDEKEIDELYVAFEEFVEKVDVKVEED